MYLARKHLNGEPHYYLRQTYRDGDILRSRNLFHLGTDPSTAFRYSGENSFYIDDTIISIVEPYVEGDVGLKLETLLWAFLDPEIRIKLEPFYQKNKAHSYEKITNEELKLIDETVHIFDRRRLHYLRYGSIDQARLWRINPKIFRTMLNKCRDEREQYFIEQEQVLEATELKIYLYTIFNVQRHFSELIARSMPQGLDQEKVDQHFLEDLCCLDEDPFFWCGTEPENRLHEYLTRYLVIFFDFGYDSSTFLNDYIRQFMNSRRNFSYPKPKQSFGDEETAAIFGVSAKKMKKMSSDELTRLYRKKAKELHPDTGGDQDTFVTLTDAYNELLTMIKHKHDK